MNKQLIKLLNTLPILLILQACSSYQEQFDCPAGVGVGCKSVRQVDQMVEKGLIGQDINQQHLHIWFAPYQDQQGYIHNNTVTIKTLDDNNV